VPRKKSPAQLNREIAEAIGGNPGHRPGQHVAHHALHWKGSKIQSLLFDRQWDVGEAKQWARDHGYKAGKVHVTDNYIRLRQRRPLSGAEKRTITFGQGIKAIVEQVR
jgi:hypothetical protein